MNFYVHMGNLDSPKVRINERDILPEKMKG